MMTTYATVVDKAERAREQERVWCEAVRLMRIEDGLRFVLDNELDLHDAVMDGQLTIRQVQKLAKRHWRDLLQVESTTLQQV